MTGPEHYKKAEQLLDQADEWLDADTGWKATMSTDERLARRSADLAAAQAHFTAALVAATALGLDAIPLEYDAWQKVCGVKA